jgi:hypothetical protein
MQNKEQLVVASFKVIIKPLTIILTKYIRVHYWTYDMYSKEQYNLD